MGNPKFGASIRSERGKKVKIPTAQQFVLGRDIATLTTTVDGVNNPFLDGGIYHKVRAYYASPRKLPSFSEMYSEDNKGIPEYKKGLFTGNYRWSDHPCSSRVHYILHCYMCVTD